MNLIADFTDNEMWVIHTTLKERYGEEIETQLAESELRLYSTDKELTTCPTLYWEHEQCHFVVFKSGDHRYRCQFFYRIHQQFGTGIDEYDDLAECVVTLLQAQADHLRDTDNSSET